jgi:pyruvate formate lyase activating enzyme
MLLKNTSHPKYLLTAIIIITIMKEAMLYKKLKNNVVECTACMHKCKILNNMTGICNVRKNISGKLFLLVYGKAVAINIDPIEKKPLYHFMPGSKILSIGTVGCNFKCSFCQNWEISQSKKIQGEDFIPKEIIETCKTEKISMIAYTYNEPAIFFEYAYDTAKLAHSKGIKNIYVTSGYETPEALKKIQPYLDSMNIDLKSFNQEFYRKYCNANLEHVLETIKKAYQMGIWIEITTLLIPDKNDSKEELKQIAEFISSISKDIPWHISAFRPCYKMLDTRPTTKEDLLKAYNIGKKAGLNYVYLGNINDVEHSTTFCPKCNEILIQRDFISDFKINLNKGKCPECNYTLPGIWN